MQALLSFARLNMDTGLAMVIAAVIAAIPASLALWNRRSLSQINRAVNHVGEGEPTLIDRVRTSEKENKEFRDWVVQALHAVANQIGTSLPKPPE